MARRSDEFVYGTDELIKKMENIKQEMRPKIVAQAARAALNPMRKNAQANAPKGDRAHTTYKGRLVAPGFLSRNIKQKRIKYRDKTRVGYTLAARGEAWYGKILETGFSHRGGRNKQGRRTEVRARPWLGPAYESQEDNVQRHFEREMTKRIRKALKK